MDNRNVKTLTHFKMEANKSMNNVYNVYLLSNKLAFHIISTCISMSEQNVISGYIDLIARKKLLICNLGPMPGVGNPCAGS